MSEADPSDGRVALYPQAAQEIVVESVILVTYETLLGGAEEQTEGVETLSSVTSSLFEWITSLVRYLLCCLVIGGEPAELKRGKQPGID